jgi:hypothetical protein
MASGVAVLPVVFHCPKAGSKESEWEDCAGYDCGDPAAERAARLVVVDGATEAYDSIRWVRQLVASFLGKDRDGGAPAVTAEGLDQWFGSMQQRWLDDAPRAFANIFEERKFHEAGSFATFLGCEINGLDGTRPSWSAAALGDTVLFQVRNGQVVRQLPRLGPEDFGLNPDGLFTQPSERGRMRAALVFDAAPLNVGDVLFLATDAFAEWLTRQHRDSHGDCWRTLTAIEHPTDFARLVDRERHARRMKNDDVTLLRVEIAPADAAVLVVCR